MGIQHSQGGDPQVPTGVSMTAIVVAQARDKESARPDRLFDDPLAEAFVAAAWSTTLPQVAALLQIYPYLIDYFAIRTRFLDEYLLTACAAGCRQVVVLAAGLDTRAFRLAWPKGVRLFELDLPEVFTFKEQVLARQSARPACQRIVVEADLSKEWSAPLIQASFRPDEPTAWLAEGILLYLTEEENDQLLTKISQLSASGSRLAFDHTSQNLQQLSLLRQANVALDELGVSWQSVLADPAMWLVSHGWQAEVSDATSRAAQYSRPVPSLEELTKVKDARWWLVRAVRNPT